MTKSMTTSDLPEGESERRRLGEKLRKAREYVGFSQDEVASFLKVPRTAVTNMENGQRKVEALELKHLADLYHQPVSHFTSDDEEASSALPTDVTHLARQAAALSPKDREELGRFADFLKMRASGEE
jgi:transcriptional regulator with XRE-family HTH domain